VKKLASLYTDTDHVADLPIRMTGEDFARYAQRFPTVFYRLGTGGVNKDKPVHHPEFDIDESSLELGAGMMAWLAMSLTTA